MSQLQESISIKLLLQGVFCVYLYILLEFLNVVCLFVGVAEQFAIAEAKLRAWTSVDEEDMDDESCEGDPSVNDKQNTTQSSGDLIIFL